MRYLSVCSGIEAATMAWHSLGFTPFAFSEIEPFPSKVLAHHYPDVPNLGDMTKYKEWNLNESIDLLVGGTPCQSFSVAGLRKGLEDPRGNLMLTYLAIAGKYKPKYILWENVPGVLSCNGGRDFATLLEGLAQLGYGWAYRVLDAQYCRTHEFPNAVPQRRRRVFVVGCLGDYGRAASVLFDTESMCGNPPPSRKKRKEAAGNIAIGVGTCSGKDTFGTLMANCGQKLWLGNQEALSGDYHVFELAGNTIGRQPENGGNGPGYDTSGASYTLTKTDVHGVCHQLIGGVDYENNGHGPDDVTGPLMKGSPTGGGRPLPAVAFKVRGGCEGGGKGYLGSDESAFTLSTTHNQYIFTQMRVRRLTPRECERLQGFPDDFTNIPGATDTARYKALGNSMAVNVMQLIGMRLAT